MVKSSTLYRIVIGILFIVLFVLSFIYLKSEEKKQQEKWEARIIENNIKIRKLDSLKIQIQLFKEIEDSIRFERAMRFAEMNGYMKAMKDCMYNKK